MKIGLVAIVFMVSCAFFVRFYPIETMSLRPFDSDGCSLFPDGSWGKPNQWCHCCLQHDLSYWRGGRSFERLQADKDMAACVLQTGAVITSYMMYSGVRVFGSPFFPTSYRWGYGWSYGRGYQALSAVENEHTAIFASEASMLQQYQRVCVSE